MSRTDTRPVRDIDFLEKSGKVITGRNAIGDNNKVHFFRPAREGFCNTIHASAQPARHINTFDKYVKLI